MQDLTKIKPGTIVLYRDPHHPSGLACHAIFIKRRGPNVAMVCTGYETLRAAALNDIELSHFSYSNDQRLALLANAKPFLKGGQIFVGH